MSSSHPKTLSLTAEQADVLADTNRVRVVRAGPGSGKTRVFVAELEKCLASWTDHVGGIAALSFTNVAADEISLRLGGPPAYPHYVGTLDSFVWRFIVRPFAHTAGVTQHGPRLVPSPLDQMLERPVLKVGAQDREQASLFSLALQVRDGQPYAVRRDRYTNRLLEVDRVYVPAIVRAKRDEWARNGRLTHADCHAIAWKIMRGNHAAEIISRLVVRFPLILLDEFQDTNYFLGRALLEILRNENARALVVGDRDQAIFTFGGADNELFLETERLSGARSHSLRTTHRFGPKIALVASMLARSGEVIQGDRTKSSRVLLLEHSSNELQLDARTIDNLKEILLREDCRSSALLARRKTWLGQTRSGVSVGACPLQSMAARSLYAAVGDLRTGESRAALDRVGRVLENLLLEGLHATPEQLQLANIDRSEWRRAARTILFSAADEVVGETWSAWLLRIKSVVRTEFERLRARGQTDQVSSKFRQGFQKRKVDGPRRIVIAPRNLPWEELTIHRAKGREFDGVVVYWPKPGGKARAGCPSGEWWSEDPSSEEREIAYVAATRAKRLLVFCFHSQTVATLKDQQPTFFNELEPVSL